ncbi:short-chain dehydrogenase/reductase [Colletotrichum godetiae]|uniref:Short-chain dehydrogenase/reductase n=1 Tax=Colletotrichum godetiae TaxID=1209918 RepID=A0AAJ0AD65_9PEZI|nr:short-chain dehydrogenase/reductase [Colletotrichum godetiae]KAK1671745.1 short-chain dehydrogenase/reductase [Colletotrichum godetiae]
MVSIQLVKQSNALVASLPKGLVAVFIGATSGIGESTLQHLAQHAESPRIYSIARPQTAASHETFLASLRANTYPDASYTILPADHALVSDIDTAMETILQKETKVDILFLSAGFIAFEGRRNTIEGLDPSMSTRYYTRLRAVQRLLPLLNNAPRPRVISVLAAGLEGPMVDEDDLDLRRPGNWGFWPASVQATTMGTLALEVLARENPGVSFVHSMPGMVATPGLERARRFGAGGATGEMSVEEAGARGLFLATSDLYDSQEREGVVRVPGGVECVKKSSGGIFLVGPQGERVDNEEVLGDMRERGLDEKVWKFTREMFDDCLERK